MESKQIKIQELRMKSFKCFADMSVTFGDSVTTISGANGVGKTTICEALTWLLFNSPKNVKMRGSGGRDTSVEAALNIGGKNVILKKNLHQSASGASKSIYYIDDIEVSAKAFGEYVSANIAPVEFLQIGAFFSKTVAERRSFLKQYVSSISNEDVIAKDEKFRELETLLSVGEPRDIINSSKKTIKLLEADILKIDAQIEESKKNKADEDFAELEIEKKTLLEKLSEIDKKLSSSEGMLDGYRTLTDHAMELKFKLSSIEREEHESLVAKQKEMRRLVDELDSKRSELSRERKEHLDAVERLNKIIASDELDIADATKEWAEFNKQEFDESSIICPCCGQEYPHDSQKSMRETFATNKEKKLSEIVARGTHLRSEIEASRELSEQESELAKSYISKIADVDSQIQEVLRQTEALPKTVDCSGRADYEETLAKLKEAEEALAKEQSVDYVRDDLREQREDVNQRILEVSTRLSKAYDNAKIDERIEELSQKRKSLVLEIMVAVQKISLVEEFETARASMMEEDVNKHFSMAQFKLFTKLVNGEMDNCCKVIVNGSDYENGLNTGHRALAAMEMLHTFQRLNNICCFMIVDDLESIDEDRIPEYPNQMIFLKHTEDKEMKIERR